MNTLFTYPTDQDNYNAYMLFVPIKFQNVAVAAESFNEATKANANEAVTNLKDASQQAVQGAVISAGLSTFNSFSTIVATNPELQQKVAGLSNSLDVDRAKELIESGSGICLPLPDDGISNDINVSWSDTKMGSLISSTYAKRGETFADQMLTLDNTIGDKWDATTNFFEQIKPVATRYVSKFLLDNTGVLGRLATGGRPLNDMAAQLFSGTDYRKFSFSWNNLTPSTFFEAVKLEKILALFEYASVPDYNPTLPEFIDFPAVWEVYLVLNSNDTGFTPEIIKYQRMALTSLKTSWFNESKALFRDGRPVKTSLTLSFTELFKHSRKNVAVPINTSLDGEIG